VVLRLTAWLANLYLIAFAGDALLSCADDALRALAGEHPALHMARTFVGLALLLASMLMPLLLLFVPHLPKLVFLPPIAFTLFFLFGTRFVPFSIAWLSVVQALVAAGSFLILRARTGAWLLAPARLPRKRYLVARTMLATMVTVVALPLMASAVVVLGLVAALERETAGWLDLTASGIDVRESVLTKDGRTVVLTAMMHYGEEDFYRTLLDGLPARSLVLAEGITDRGKRLSAFPSALKIAKMFGLTQQPGLGGATRPRAAGAAPSHPGESRPPTTGSGTHPDVVRADIDAAEFSDTTIAVLHDLAGLYGGDAMTESLRRLVARTRTGDDLAVFKREVIDMRNANLLATFDDRAEAYTTIMIPWGALHMPGLEAGLLERGYRVDTQRQRAVVRFGTIAGWLTGRG